MRGKHKGIIQSLFHVVIMFGLIGCQESISPEVLEAKQIALACASYASDWDGKYPQQLSELYPQYLDDQEVLFDDDKKLRWVYLHGQTKDDYSGAPLFRSRDKIGDYYIIAYVGGHIAKERELEKQIDQASGNSREAWGPSQIGLQCSLTLNGDTFLKDEKITAIVKVRNTTNGTIQLESIPAITVSGENYSDSKIPVHGEQIWCPFYLEKGNHIGPNLRSVITLDPGTTHTVDLVLTELSWADGMSSTWPHIPFNELINPGVHDVRCSIQITGGKINNWLKSNLLKIEIKKP